MGISLNKICYTLILFFYVLCILTGSSQANQSSTTIAIDPITIEDDTAYQTMIHIHNVSQVIVLSINVTWDPSMVNVTDVVWEGGVSDFDSVFYSVNESLGVVSLDAYRFGDEGLSGDVVVVELSVNSVESVQDGQSTWLNISDSRLYNSDEQQIDHDLQPGYIRIKQSQEDNNDEEGNGGGNNNGGGSDPSVNHDPVAILHVSSTTETVHTDIVFNASESYDPDGDQLHYRWDFGTDEYSSEHIITYQYQTPGIYTVTLTVHDGRGGTDQTATTVHIAPMGNHPPTNVTVSFPSQQIRSGQPVPFDIYATDPDQQDRLMYHVQWGDGSTSHSHQMKSGGIWSINHTYTTYGIYSVNISVTDASNTSSSTYSYLFYVDLVVFDTLFDGWLIDTDADGQYDTLTGEDHNASLKSTGGDIIHIDLDNDGAWDYTYDINKDYLSPYMKTDVTSEQFPFIFYVGLILIILALLLGFMFHKTKK